MKKKTHNDLIKNSFYISTHKMFNYKKYFIIFIVAFRILDNHHRKSPQYSA